MEENRAENQTPQRQHAQAKTHQAHKKKGGTVKKVIGTILAIGLTTCLMFFAIFMIYVHTSLDLDVDISAYTLKQSSTVYYQDKPYEVIIVRWRVFFVPVACLNNSLRLINQAA